MRMSTPCHGVNICVCIDYWLIANHNKMITRLIRQNMFVIFVSFDRQSSAQVYIYLMLCCTHQLRWLWLSCRENRNSRFGGIAQTCFWERMWAMCISWTQYDLCTSVSAPICHPCRHLFWWLSIPPPRRPDYPVK